MFIVDQVLELLKTLFSKTQNEPSTCSDKDIPKGHLQLYAMRLADVFSDDSNFRSYVTLHIVSFSSNVDIHCVSVLECI